MFDFIVYMCWYIDHIRRDANGCNNGCRVLGYRVYINNLPVVSVDGPASFKTEIPHQTSSDFEVYLW